jgi:hypothetical protein
MRNESVKRETRARNESEKRERETRARNESEKRERETRARNESEERERGTRARNESEKYENGKRHCKKNCWGGGVVSGDIDVHFTTGINKLVHIYIS